MVAGKAYPPSDDGAVGETHKHGEGPSPNLTAVRMGDPTPRYLRNGRDLAEYIHYDFQFQAFLNAALILLNYCPEAILNENRPVLNELNPYKRSKVEDGFATFGLGQVLDWLGWVTTASLKATWVQKWLVHRRLRPEALGGRVHQTRTEAGAYPIHRDVLDSVGVEQTYQRTGSYLFPQAYPEASPIHPSYPGGHATVAATGAGACSVILKVFFDEGALMSNCVHAAADGLTLEPCPSDFVPTVGNEINKLVSNVAMGRSWRGSATVRTRRPGSGWERTSLSQFCRIWCRLVPRISMGLRLRGITGRR